ncbi:hypothetical protein TWF481_010632 [Arthrobotrys musiformis]|uniref:Uncharacterized protein n=1 Tax=Arthrobotrys musiformis TaxID=47236 RepID=A0AAV9W1F5_9PEZI
MYFVRDCEHEIQLAGFGALNLDSVEVLYLVPVNWAAVVEYECTDSTAEYHKLIWMIIEFLDYAFSHYTSRRPRLRHVIMGLEFEPFSLEFAVKWHKHRSRKSREICMENDNEDWDDIEEEDKEEEEEEEEEAEEGGGTGENSRKNCDEGNSDDHEKDTPLDTSPDDDSGSLDDDWVSRAEETRERLSKRSEKHTKWHPHLKDSPFSYEFRKLRLGEQPFRLYSARFPERD